MSDSNSTAFKYFGLNCPNGGEFYICEGDATEFIGCCTSNPCGANKGVCPSGNLRASSFNQDVYADLPQQNCSNSAGVTNWYTCAYTNPPFMGCCSEPACNSGCARSNLVPAVLSSNENNKLDFLTPDGDSSQTSASPSGSATSTGTSSASASASTSAAASDSEGGLGTGAVAGIAAGSAAVGVLLLGFLIWKFWWAPRKRKQEGQVFSPVARSSHMPDQPGTPGTFYSGQSPMSHYQQSFASTPTAVAHYPSGVSMDQYGKISPQTATFDRPISMSTYSDVSSVPRGYGQQQPYSPMPMIPVQEMDGTSHAPPQELGTGHEHMYSPGQSPGLSSEMTYGVSPNQSPNPNPPSNQLGISNR